MTDAPGPAGRAIDLSVDVPGTPDEVWAAIATGDGIGSWFVPATVVEGVGGRIDLDFGSPEAPWIEKGPITAWEPPALLAYTTGSQAGGALAYEWTVVAAAGGTCTVRMVCSGFGPGEEWDGDYDGLSGGWRIFLEHLRLRRTYLPGQPARSRLPMFTVPGPRADAWAAVCDGLGVSADLAVGDRFEANGADAPVLAGTVGTSWPGTLYLVVLDEPAAGTAFVAVEGADDADRLSVSVWRYLDRSAPDVDDISPWAAERFPA